MKGKCMSLMPMMMVPMGSLAPSSTRSYAGLNAEASWNPVWPSRPGSPPPPCFATASSTGTWVPSEIGLWNFQKPFNLFSLSFYHSDTGRQNSCMERFFSKTIGLENPTMCAQLTEMRKVRPRGNEPRWFVLMNTIAIIRTRWWEVNVGNISNSQWSQRQR